jgi:hypothetical protein
MPATEVVIFWAQTSRQTAEYALLLAGFGSTGFVARRRVRDRGRTGIAFRNVIVTMGC